MKAFNFTPGPWGYTQGPSYLCNGMIGVGPTLHNVALVETRHGINQGMSNARLIAAAPELLNILSRIVRANDSGNNGAVMGEAVLCPMFADMARAAIAKATQS